MTRRAPYCAHEYGGRECCLHKGHNPNWPHVSVTRGGRTQLWISDPDQPGRFVCWHGSKDPGRIKEELGRRMASTFKIPEGP